MPEIFPFKGSDVVIVAMEKFAWLLVSLSNNNKQPVYRDTQVVSLSQQSSPIHLACGWLDRLYPHQIQ